MNPEEFQAQTQELIEQLTPLVPSHPQVGQLLNFVGQLQQTYQEQLARQDALIAEQQSLIEQLKRLLFGPKSEKLSAPQEAQLAVVAQDLIEQAERAIPDSQDILADEGGDSPEGKPSRRSRGGRHPLPVQLEVHTTVLEPEQAECEICGRLGDKIGEEVSEQIDLIPAQLVVRRTVRIKRRCHCGCGGIAIAPLPAALLPGSKLGLGLAVFILLAKYDDHVALYTLERMFRERHGVTLPRQQMVQWIEHLAGLLRLIVDRMWQRMKQGHYVQIDETPVRVLDPEVQGKAARGYLWFFGVPGGDVFLVFDRGRSHQVPATQLEGFQGVFQSDAFEAYETLQKKCSGLRRLGCAAHARRKFYEAALEGDTPAIWFIGRFRQLYRMEDQLRVASPADRQATRQTQAPPIWAEMKTRAKELQPHLLPKSSLGKAVNYFLNEYDALQVYLEAPEYQIDNNLIENSIRPSCVGKKRWLFIGHPQAGWRSAVIYSILQSCRRRGLNPQEYLTDVLRRLPVLKNTEIDQLLPQNWKVTPKPAPP
jgi:transposase